MGEGGEEQIKRVTLKYTLPYVKLIASGKLPYSTGAQHLNPRAL